MSQCLVIFLVALLMLVIAIFFIAATPEKYKPYQENYDWVTDKVSVGDPELTEQNSIGTIVQNVLPTKAITIVQSAQTSTVFAPGEQKSIRISLLPQRSLNSCESGAAVLVDGQQIFPNIGGSSSGHLFIGSVYTAHRVSRGNSHSVLSEMPEIVFHNRLLIPITFNCGRIQVPASSTFIYKGPEQTGISRGLTLHNDQDLFADVTLTQNITDIVYGAITERYATLYRDTLSRVDGEPIVKEYIVN